MIINYNIITTTLLFCRKIPKLKNSINLKAKIPPSSLNLCSIKANKQRILYFWILNMVLNSKKLEKINLVRIKHTKLQNRIKSNCFKTKNI